MPKYSSIVGKFSNNKWLVFGIILVITIGGWLVFRQYEIQQEKQRFEQARVSIDALYAEIVKVAGEPDKSEKSASCGYAELKFDRGDLSCGVSTRFVYGIKNKEQASELFQKIKAAMVERADIFTITFSEEDKVVPFRELRDRNDEKEVGIDLFDKSTNIICTSKIVYADSSNYSNILNSNSQQENLSGYISCSDDARAEHYPVKKT